MVLYAPPTLQPPSKPPTLRINDVNFLGSNSTPAMAETGALHNHPTRHPTAKKPAKHPFHEQNKQTVSQSATDVEETPETLLKNLFP